MICCYVESVGLAAPGLSGWLAAQPVLRGLETLPLESPRSASEPPYAPTLLPANERRRATATIQQAFRAGEDALARTARDPATLATVFATADADLQVLHRICTALAKSPRLVSPTDFHNSVHNAASGYFGIAIRSMMPATTLAAFNDSFAAALLEAATLVVAEQRAVLLIAYDVIAPEPLLTARTLTASGSCAMLLSSARTNATLAELTLRLVDGEPTACANATLESLRRGCPALRALPLLATIALGSAAETRLALGPGRALVVRCA